MEAALMNAMYDVPDDKTIGKVVVTEKTIHDGIAEYVRKSV
jgi:ATP-dependent protease Clp ATPase subunit